MIYFIGAYLMIGRFYYIIGSLTGLIFLPITELIEWLKN